MDLAYTVRCWDPEFGSVQPILDSLEDIGVDFGQRNDFDRFVEKQLFGDGRVVGQEASMGLVVFLVRDATYADGDEFVERATALFSL